MSKKKEKIPWRFIIYVFLIVIIAILGAVYWKYIKPFLEAVGALGVLWAAASLGSIIADIIALIGGALGFLVAGGSALYKSGQAFRTWLSDKEEVTDEEMEQATENAETYRDALNEAENLSPTSEAQLVLMENDQPVGDPVPITSSTVEEAGDTVNDLIAENSLMDSSTFDIILEPV